MTPPTEVACRRSCYAEHKSVTSAALPDRPLDSCCNRRDQRARLRSAIISSLHQRHLNATHTHTHIENHVYVYVELAHAFPFPPTVQKHARFLAT